MRKTLYLLFSISRACTKKVEYGQSSSKFTCEETGHYNGHTQCIFEDCNYDGQCTEMTCLIRYDGSIDGESKCETMTMRLPTKLRNRILARTEYDYEPLEGSGMYDCLDGTSDDEELDCIGVTTSGTFNRPTDDPNQSTNQAQSLLTYENVILLIGTFLGFIGAILLGFLIAKSKQILCFKEKVIPPAESEKFLNNA